VHAARAFNGDASRHYVVIILALHVVFLLSIAIEIRRHKEFYHAGGRLYISTGRKVLYPCYLILVDVAPKKKEGKAYENAINIYCYNAVNNLLQEENRLPRTLYQYKIFYLSHNLIHESPL
jgi:hypothetical protein